MKPHNTNVLISVFGLLLVPALLALFSPSISRAGGMTDIGTLGGTDSVAYGVNPNGRIVGSSYTPTGETHAFLYDGGVITDLGTLMGGSGSEAYAIDAQGRIAGVSFVSPDMDKYHAFLYADGTMTDLGTLGGDSSTANGINDNGQVVGGSHISSGATHAFLHAGGAMTDLGTLGGTSSYATAINNAGQIAGWSDTASGESHAFLYSGGRMRDLGTLGGNGSLANAINSKGQVAGWFSLPSGVTHAFTYTDDTSGMIDLGTLGGDNSEATAINNAGQVVGWSDTASGESHAFLYSGGKMRDLGTLRGGHVSSAASINDAGQVVGWSLNSSESFRAVLYSPGSPFLFAQPSFLDFGRVKKSGSRVKEVSIRNHGPGNLILSAITVTGAEGDQFSATSNCSAPLLQGGSCTVTVTFEPTSYGPKNASLTITSNDPRRPSYAVDLKGGCPYPRMVITPAYLDFGEVSQKQSSRVRVVTIRNTSISDLSVSSIKLSDEVSFARTDSCTTVVRGVPCSIKLTFTPQTPGPTAGLLTISSDDRRGSAGVKLYGRGK